MASISYQAIFNTKCDFKNELSSIVSESFEDNYIDYDELTLESTLVIKYEREHGDGGVPPLLVPPTMRDFPLLEMPPFLYQL